MKSIVWVRTALRVRRWPLLMLGIVIANVVLFGLVRHRDEQRELYLAERCVVALAYYQQHPYLTLKPPLNEFVDARLARQSDANVTNLADVSSVVARAATKRRPYDAALLLREQAELDAKVGAFARVADQWQSSSLGYVPAAPRAWNLISYQFVHASWIHLLGNMGFLVLIGVGLERAWRRRWFVPFYLMAGVVAALGHTLAAPQSVVPLVGASGAIAGLLGAIAVHAASYRASRYAPLLVRSYRYWAPVLLLLWFLVELSQAALILRREGTASHFAHVGGFVFGLAFAYVTHLRRNGMQSLQARS